MERVNKQRYRQQVEGESYLRGTSVSEVDRLHSSIPVVSRVMDHVSSVRNL